MSEKNIYTRYQKQLILHGFGEEAQNKLKQAKVLMIGAGGLGCAALQYIVAAGVGVVGVVDFDRVELGNLHRQVLYTHDDIGRYKAEVAVAKLANQNIEIEINPYVLKLDNKNALELIAQYDWVIDGSDNFETRYLVNDACVILNKPLIYGSVMKYEGQLGVFNGNDDASKEAVNYRDLFPEPPKSNEFLSCDDLGVIGVLPGLIGTMQATEVIKLITNIGTPLTNKILTYNVLNHSSYEFLINKNPLSSKAPRDRAEFEKFDYQWFCHVKSMGDEISYEEFKRQLIHDDIMIIDVRERDEQPIVKDLETINIPLGELATAEISLSNQQKIVLFCNSGIRSKLGVELLKKRFPNQTIYSLKDGIIR